VPSLLRTLVALALLAAPAAGADIPERGAGFHFLLAKSLADDGRFREALSELDAAESISGAEPFLLLERAELLMQMGRLSEASATVARARALLPDDPDVLRLQGRVELARGEEDPSAIPVARDALERLIESRPEDLEVLLSLGQIYLTNGMAQRAVEMLERASRLRPNHPWIESMRARALEAAGQTDAADHVQRETLERNPGDLIVRFELVDRLGQQGRHGEALELLRGAPEAQRRRLDYREREARELFLGGDAEGALPVAESIASESESRPESRLLLARIEIVLGFFDRAEGILAALEPGTSHDVTDLRVRALTGAGRTGEAVELLERVARQARESGDAGVAATTGLEIARLWSRVEEWDLAARAAAEAGSGVSGPLATTLSRLRARALVAAGRSDEALAFVAGATFQSDRDRQMVRVETLIGAKRFGEAERAAQALLEGWEEGSLAVGAAYQERDEFGRALPLLERALRQQPDSLEALFRTAICLERTGRRDEAEDHLRRVVEGAPRFAPALNYLGYLWIERGEHLDQAIGLVREAVRLEPDNGAYVDSLGWGEFQRGRFGRAVALLERATRLEPGDATILEHLGDARAAGGDPAGALEAYRLALAHEPPAAAELEAKIARLDGKN